MKLIVITAYCLAIIASQNITPKNQIKMVNQEINGLPKMGSYLGSLDLLEKMAGKKQRTLVEEELLTHKLN